jgi:hypothetical protein
VREFNKKFGISQFFCRKIQRAGNVGDKVVEKRDKIGREDAGRAYFARNFYVFRGSFSEI